LASEAWTPKKIFLTSGKGVHKEKLASFELALREAGIAALNLISVSSILPPHCDFIPKEEGVLKLNPGQVVPVVLARMESKKPNQFVSSGIGVAVPSDRSHYGYLSEHHDIDMDAKKMEDYVEDLAAEMLATTYGIKFDPHASWDEKREIWSIDDRIVKTQSVIEVAETSNENLWTTVVSAAVLII
tara:strand:+ start:6674 stop:7231 length:558 start_codon:yes stop_codon:yes gene_type:complete